MSNPDAPVVLSGVDTPLVQSGNFETVTNGSGLALVAAGFRGLQLHNAANNDVTFDLIQEFPTPGTAQSVAVAGGVAFVADGSAGLQIINYLPFDSAGVTPTVAIETNAVDVDSATAGIQLIEGSRIGISPTITDDVQVRNAELLINGETVRNDASFPFDFTTTIPVLANGADSVTLQVRATDTGGNTTLSNEIIIDIVPDTIPPVIESLLPIDGGIRLEGTGVVRIQFSEPLAESSIANGVFQIVAAGPENQATSHSQYRMSSGSPARTEPRGRTLEECGFCPRSQFETRPLFEARQFPRRPGQ